MRTKRNVISALVLQIVTVISGLILPRIVISEFGSNVNGLVSSITQFLNFIALLEGGIGAVILSQLYKPIENNDVDEIEKLLGASNSFFRKLALIFILYTGILCIVYPFFVEKSFGFVYVSTLILIICVVTLMQYLFSVTNRLLLQANQEVYIVNYLSAVTVVINLILTITIVNIYPEIHIVKIGSSVAFVIQPLFYNYYVRKKYGYKCKNVEGFKIPNRWSGFSQNFAHFINMNTDIVLITIFGVLTDASVYSVYFLALNAIKQIITAVNNSYQSNLGKYIATGNKDSLCKHFYRFTSISWISCTALFSTCLLLINQFVGLYTVGVNDANYYQPVFALIMTIAQYIYCLREPYRFLILSGGKFRETNFGSILEAVLNIIVSISLIKPLGIVGVAIGTLIAIGYRMIYFLVFLKDNIIYLKLKNILPNLIASGFLIVLNVYFYYLNLIKITSIISFLLYGVIVLFIEAIASLAAFKCSDILIDNFMK